MKEYLKNMLEHFIVDNLSQMALNNFIDRVTEEVNGLG